MRLNSGEFYCFDCGGSVWKKSTGVYQADAPTIYDIKDFCPNCGERLEELVLFTSKVKICRKCEKDGTKVPEKEKWSRNIDSIFDDTYND